MSDWLKNEGIINEIKLGDFVRLTILQGEQ